MKEAAFRAVEARLAALGWALAGRLAMKGKKEAPVARALVSALEALGDPSPWSAGVGPLVAASRLDAVRLEEAGLKIWQQQLIWGIRDWLANLTCPPRVVRFASPCPKPD